MRFNAAHEQRHLSIASPTTSGLYRELKAAVLNIADDIVPYTTEKKYIGFHVGGRRITIFQVHRAHIYIWLHLKPDELTGPPGEQDVRKYDTHCSISVTPETNLNGVVGLIRQSYKKNKERARRPSLS